MHKVVIASLCLLLVWGCKGEKNAHKSVKRLPGTWQSTPVVADGKRNEWPVPYPYENTKAVISYAISNDKNNLYITVETGDPATELKILRHGLVVWIDRTATKTQSTSVCFPSDNEHGHLKAAPGPELGRQVDEALASIDEFYLNGFKGCRGKFSFRDGDTCGISVGIGLDEYDQLIWEAVIPFKTFYPKAAIDRYDMGRALDICFDIEALTPPDGMNRSDGGGPRLGVGVGGFGMGMSTGTGFRNSRNSGGTDEHLYKKTVTWQQVGIAFKE